MRYADRIELPIELRPGRRFDMAEANKRHKWLRTGTLDVLRQQTNRAARRARRPRTLRPPSFESEAQKRQWGEALLRKARRDEARAARKAVRP